MTPNIDNEMKLLAGMTIYVDEIPIKPLKLRDITEIGYIEFQQNIQILLLDLDTMIESIDDFEAQATMKANRHMYKVFDLFMLSAGLTDLVIKSFKMIFETDDIEYVLDRSQNYNLVINKEHIISRDNFDEISKVIEMQNNPKVSKKDAEDDEYKPADELAKRIAEKLKKSKEIVAKSKAVEENKEGITISDIISSVSAMSNSINKTNIWEYTLYQLYEEFARLNRIDDYRLQIQASMWSSDIEIKHWSEPL